MIIEIIGSMLLIASIICFWLYRKARGKYQEILLTPTTSVKNINESHQAVCESLGPENYNEYVELKGDMACEEPLISQLGEQECVYYQAKVEREYEEEEWVTDSEGHRDLRRTSGRETIYNQSESVSFYLVDQSGKIKINPEGSNIDLIKSIKHSQPSQDLQMITYGNFKYQPPNDFGNRITRGYHFYERIFPIEQTLYVLGRATDEKGELEITTPLEKGQKYIISHKSEGTLISESQKTSGNFKAAAIILGVIALITIVCGLFTSI